MKIRLDGLSKKFFSLRGEVAAVDRVNLEIPDGSFFVLLGPSGCGKSTMLNLIAGLETPTAGEIWFDDQRVSRAKNICLPPKERRIGMVFQSYALYPHLTVFENIAFPLRLQGMKGDRLTSVVTGAAETLGLTGLLRAKPGELSGGERQRVAIGRAIVRQPEILLFDEPLSNLDAQLRLSTRLELKKLQQRLGKTMVYVTHDQVEAMTLGDRIALLKDGRLVQSGTADELYEKPVNTFAASFIGSPPMNLLHANFLAEGAKSYLVVERQKILVSERNAAILKTASGDELILGIRPEHISAQNVDNAMKGSIDTVEMHGREIIWHVLIGGRTLSMVTANRESKAGDRVGIVFDLERMHFFDVTGARRLS